MKKLKICVAVGIALAVSACGNLSKVKDGNTANPVFPKAIDAWETFNDTTKNPDTFPYWNNVKQVMDKKGLNKDQVYALLGEPHFNEGFFGVREWDYVFNFQENGQPRTCQFKLLFDKEEKTSNFFWFPNGCNTEKAINVSADSLFGFNKDQLTDDGKFIVADLANSLKNLGVKYAEIEAYTDPIGSDAYNLKLSQRRAETVKSALLQAGLDAYLTAKGMGETNQVKHCEGKGVALQECLSPNRRFVIKTSGQVADSSSYGNIGPAFLYK